MAKILVVYHSKTGHTEKMAFAVAEGAKQVKGIDVVVRKVDETSNEDLLNADGIIVGSPTYYGQMSWKVKKLLDKSVKIHGKLEGKVGAVFTSSGGIVSGAETTLLSILCAMLIHGMIIQGRAETKHYGAASVGSPKDKDIKICRTLGKRTSILVKKLKP
jgi:NAD(P)H dehydrogenase (quinone)